MQNANNLVRQGKVPGNKVETLINQPRSQVLFPGLGAGLEKALGSAGHMISEHPKILGVLNYTKLTGTFKMAVPSREPKFLSVLRRVGISLNNGNFPSLNLKPLQMKCFEYMLEGQDFSYTFIYFYIPSSYLGLVGKRSEREERKKFIGSQTKN